MPLLDSKPRFVKSSEMSYLTPAIYPLIGWAIFSAHARALKTVRYIHTHVGIINIDDYIAALDLLEALLKKLDKAAVDAIYAG